MSLGTDPAALIDRLVHRNGHAPAGEDGLAEARAVAAGLAGAPDARAAIRAALDDPAAIAAVAAVAAEDRAAYESLLLALKAPARDVKAFERAVNGAVRQRRRQRRHAAATLDGLLAPVRADLPDAPVPEAAVVPLGWRLGPTAVARERATTNETGATRSELEVVAPAPVVIAGRLVSINDGTEAMRLAWRRDGRWKQATVNREKIANARALVDVAALGLPVTSGTAGDLVRYLAAFEAANIGALPRARVSHQLGWQGGAGDQGFLWGRTLIKPDGGEPVEVDLDAVAPADWREDWLAFRGEDAGDEQLAEGYRAAGTFEAWRDAVATVADCPTAIVALYASLAAPLLEILGCQNFVVDWSHMTSTGKTTVLRLAASVWGSPDERTSAAAMQTWDVSRVWLERAAATLHSIPLILDDTKRAKNTQLVTQTIYDLVSGRGRGRGSPLGTRRMLTWRTVLLSSGEQRITDFSQDGGTRPRVLELWGMPFGATDRETGALVQRLSLALLQHYGHAGPRFVRWLLAHRDRWPEWTEQFRATQRALGDRAGDNPFAGRIAEPLAALSVAEALAHAALDLPWPYREVAAGLWDAFAGEASEADRAAAALTVALNWAYAHPSQFYHPSAGTEPPSGWAGRWDKGDDWEWIGYFPERVRAVLDAAGFDAAAMVRLWHDRGWLTCDAKRQTRITRIGQNPVRLVAIRREVAVSQANEQVPP